MPNIPVFSAPTAPVPALPPQNAGQVDVMSPGGSATQSYFDPTKIASALGQNGQGSGNPAPMSGAQGGQNNISGAQPGVNPMTGAPDNTSWAQQLQSWFGSFGGGK